MPQQDIGKKRSCWELVAIQALATFLLIHGTIMIFVFHRLDILHHEMRTRLLETNARYQRLHAQARFDSKRRQLALGLRDEIQRIRPELELSRTRDYAKWVVSAAEKFTGVDPAMLVSIGIVESGYDAAAVSHAGARGLYQILPATGRSLARSLGWEYTDEMLHDARKNTELAAFYLEQLSTSHDDVRIVLAEYNGGPLNAAYYRAGSSDLADETRDYVPKVLEVYLGIRNKVTVGTSATLQNEPIVPGSAEISGEFSDSGDLLKLDTN